MNTLNDLKKLQKTLNTKSYYNTTKALMALALLPELKEALKKISNPMDQNNSKIVKLAEKTSIHNKVENNNSQRNNSQRNNSQRSRTRGNRL